MKWQTREEVMAAARESRQAALDSVRLHWKNLSTATPDELAESKIRHLTATHGGFCALCQLPGDECFDRCCPASSTSGSCCNGLWHYANTAWNHNDWADFTSRAAKVYEYLEGLEI